MNIKAKIYHFWNNPDGRTQKVNRNISYSLIIKGFGILISLLLVPLTLGYLNPYEYGIWITLNSILTWINYFDIGLGNGLRNKLTEALAIKDYNMAQMYVSTALVLLFFIALILYALFLILSSFISWYDILNVESSIRNLDTIVMIVMFCMCICFVLRIIGTIFLSYQNTWVNDFLTFAGSLLAFVWIYILTCTSEGSLMKVAIAFSLSPVIVYLIAFPITFFKFHKEIRPCIKAVKLKYANSLVGLGIQFFALQLSCLMIYATSNFIISKLFSPAEVTPYNIAFKYCNLIVMGFSIIISPLWSAITDAYVRKDLKWIILNLNKMIKIWGLCCLALLLMVLVSQPIFHLWIGYEVLISYSLCFSLAIYSSIYMWCILFCAYSNGTGALKIQMLTMSVGAILFIPVAIFVAKHIGLVGIAYSMGTVLLIPGIALAIEYKYSIRKLKNIYSVNS